MPEILNIPSPDYKEDFTQQKENPPNKENIFENFLGVGTSGFKMEDIILIGLFFFLYQEKEKNAELLISLAILFFLGLK